ncbi:MAG TPA: hypothetical protein VFM93_13510 [Candidatus Limnocylindria bacterium]|nr:hypothetical protein [Candidatus Limnocylindria bacterium]
MTARIRTLVVSSDPDRRERWARDLADVDPDPLRCGGPRVSCALLSGGDCALLREADLALYDRDDYLPELARRISAGVRCAAVIVAEDGPARSLIHGRLAPRGGTFGCFGEIPGNPIP